MKRIIIILFVFLFLIIGGSLTIILIYENNKTSETFVEKEEKINQSEDKLIEIIKEEPKDISFIDEEKEFIEEIKIYNTSLKILNLINTFDIIEGDEFLLSAKVIYNNKQGTEYDLLRLAFNVLIGNGFQGAILIYEYEEDFGIALNFRDIEKPMYYYFEEGILKIDHHGWSFDELIVKEEERLGIKIERYGALFEGDLLGDHILNVKNVEMWKKR